MPRCYLILSLLLVSGCQKGPGEPGKRTELVGTAPSSDSVIYDVSENMGKDRHEPEKSVDTRFATRIKQLRSGILTIFLDSASSNSRPGARQFFPADSVKITGLGPIDRFTQGCKYGSGPWRPTIGILRDTVYERFGRPRFIWVLDTLNVRIRPLPTDSASCLIAGPE